MVCSEMSTISFWTRLKYGYLFFLLENFLYKLSPMAAFLFARGSGACLLSSAFVFVVTVLARGRLSSGSEVLSFSSSSYPSSAPSWSSQLVARCLDMITFPLSKWSISGIKLFHLVFAVLLKCFSKGVQPIADCFEILKYQMIFSIDSISNGLGNSNDIASSFNLIV